MARPQKQGLDYFPIDCNLFSNKKIKSLRREHGLIGILTYVNILTKVYGNGYYYKFESIEDLSFDIAEEIANEQLKKVASCVTECISYLVGTNQIDKGYFEQNIITGRAIQEQYKLSIIKSKRNIIMSEYLLIDAFSTVAENGVNSEETAVNTEETAVNTEDSTQSKVNKIKQKEEVSMYIKDSHISSNARENKLESYEEIMDDMAVAECVKPMLWEFIKHCQLNKRTLTNDKLTDICMRLDFTFCRDEAAKIECLKAALSGGYYDIKV